MDDGTIDWVGAIRRHHEGTMLFAGVAAGLSFVIDGESGRLVMPVAKLALGEDGAVLFVPEERDGALELMLAGAQVDPVREAACDRWPAYHGRTTERFWGSFAVGGAKIGRDVADIDAVDLRNRLHACEGRLCRLVHADLAGLARACRGVCGIDLVEPLCVGVDDGGLDVRARFGVLRLEFGRRVETEDEAAAVIGGLLSGGSEG